MPVMLERWNDDRMDALAGRVDDLGVRMEKGFARIDADIRDLRGEMKAELREQRRETKAGFDRMEERFERIDESFQRMYRTSLQACVVLVAALIGVIATQL